MNNEKIFRKMQKIVVLFEVFITYGGISIMEIETINIGLQEAMDFKIINQEPKILRFFWEN